ncbi:MAG: hypothetical protein GY749_01015, partial [Desulfobacteraceae bacterium]|nr:hypothetical protein [Desulfobacteraceae bacterium]
NSEINTSSEKGKSGNITLAVNHLAVSGNGKISTGEKKASSGNIDIISGGNIDITAKDSVIISGNGNLLAQAKGKTENDHTGNIRISAPVITFKDNGVITNDTFGPASGGNIILNGDRLDMNKGYISSSTEGTGKGGSVSITAKQSVNISGSETGEPGLHGIYYGIYSQAKPEASGSGGNISISANELNIANDAWINGQAYGGDSGGNVTLEVNHLNINKGGTISTSTRGKGSSGNINITAAESVNILGPGIVTDKSLKSFVYASTHSSGQGGNITISSPVLVVGKYGALETDTLGGGTSDGNILEHGTAGKIALDVDLFELRDGGKVSAETLSVGRGGDIEIKTEKLVLYNDALITAKSSGSGDAGDILINADDTIRIEKSALKTKADNADGGNITVNTQNMLNITDSDITAEVGGGEGNGGNITMNPKLAVVDNSQITADAYKGNGGNIRVVSDGFIQSSDSRVSASSELGIDGSIEIESADIGEDLTVLPADFLDAAQWIKTPCSERSGEKVGSFVMAGRDGLPTPLDDWLASPPFPFDKDGKSEKQGTDSLWQLLFKGEELYFKGDFSNAVQLWEQAMNLLDPGKRAYFHTLIYLSDAYQALGHYQSALSSLNKALTIVEKNDTPYLNALFFSSLGNIALCFGNLTEAEEYLEKGIKEARLANNPNVLANVLNILGNVLAVDGDYQGAMSAYEKSLDIIDHSAGVIHDLAMLKSKILINIAHAKFMKGDYEEAVTLMGDALLQIINLPDSHQKASDFVSLSLLAQKIRNRHTQSGNQFKDIIFRALNKARRLAEKLGDTRIVSYACGYLAQLYEEENRYSETVSLTREALFFAQQGNCPEILYLWQWQLGRLLKLEGYIEKSVKAYNDAINTLKPIRKEFFIGYRSKKNIFYEKVKPVYLGLAELLLKQAENKVGKHQEDKLKQAMNTMELLKAAELQDYFEDECVTAKHKKFIEPDNIPSHTAVIYPILFPDHLTLLLTLPKGMKQVNVPVNSEKLRKKAKRFRERLQEFSKKNRVLHYAKPLYEC